MPGLKMAESGDHQRQFQAAVDVIQNLPKNGSYRPSYEVMLRFYGLYKQAVCGPCTVSRPGFWDPVGRYKWDAWNRLGDMSSEGAMAAYVDEMKRVAQEVIDTMAMDERTASFFHYFEPLYKVIHDMPRPPDSLLSLQADINANDQTSSLLEAEQQSAACASDDVISACPPELDSRADEAYHTDQERVEDEDSNTDLDLSRGSEDDTHTVASVVAAAPPAVAPAVEQREREREGACDLQPSTQPPEPDSVSSDGLAPTSDSESEIYCDTVEQLDNGKQEPIQSAPVSDVLDSLPSAPSPTPEQHPEAADHQGAPQGAPTPVSRATEVGLGQGGEGGEGGGRPGPPMRRRAAAAGGGGGGGGRDAARQHARQPRGQSTRTLLLWFRLLGNQLEECFLIQMERHGFERDAGGERGVPPGGGGGGGEDGSGGSDPDPRRLQEAQVQQQIVLALRRLREDMQSVMERLEVVEGLAAANAHSSNWRAETQTAPAAREAESEWWWPFDVSGRTLLLLLLWPFLAQGLVFLLQRRRRRKPHVPS
ncbi:acyl-CoA-binding domain-containing protein 4 [Engraulis encrasicolus]|uniref:acyl-CoA-binding domain-containing protein 4 n=1 Tax=Engraulis encrasicolus TaxID=184585 RepID=UPI002FD46E1A